jgi:DNA-directed RNA polymerase I, II, and III subunit RPABC1
MEDAALATIKQILTKRGSTADSFDTVATPLDETKMYLFGNILIIFSTKTRVTEKEFNNFIGFASENNHTNGILIVTPSRPSDMVLSVLRNYVADRENALVQIFELRHLQFDISKNRKVPAHRIISDDEKTTMMKEYNVLRVELLPKIDCQDPMAKWIGARPGDVVEITGLCEASCENKRYRYCVADVTNG